MDRIPPPFFPDKTRSFHNLLSNDEAAEVLGVDRKTLPVWRSTKRYNLPYIKVGRLVKYRLEDLEAFLNQRTIK